MVWLTDDDLGQGGDGEDREEEEWDTSVEIDQQHSLIWVDGKEESRMTPKVLGSNLPERNLPFPERGKMVQGVHRLGGGR